LKKKKAWMQKILLCPIILHIIIYFEDTVINFEHPFQINHWQCYIFWTKHDLRVHSLNMATYVSWNMLESIWYKLCNKAE
jgi:hypothetical protein